MNFSKKKEDKLDKQVLAQDDSVQELEHTAYTIVQQPGGHWAVARVRFNLNEVDRVKLENSDLKEHAVERLKIVLAREVM